MNEIEILKQKLSQFSQPGKIAFLKHYMSTPYEFKYGVKVPNSRKIAKEYKNKNIYEIYNLFDELWNTRNHELMSLGIHILQENKKKFSIETWKFLKPRLEKACTWDHVDWLATDIVSQLFVSGFIQNSEIKELSESKNPWMRRIAIESTFKLIKKNNLELTFLLAEKLVYDEDKFVQKGVGWMLREAGKKNRLGVRDFILRHLDMKPIAFSYATEKMKELRLERKKEDKINKIDKRLEDKFMNLHYEQIKELMKNLNINTEGDILNVQKKDILIKIAEFKDIKEIKTGIKELNKK